jgi:predicted enzyme related to lactoylglutathione lyase
MAQSSGGKGQMDGLRTVIYHVNDIVMAKEWYTKILGIPPYFDQPFYVGFSVGGFELGLHPDMAGITMGTNVVAYWGVADARRSYQRLLDLGATAHQAIADVGEGILLGTVLDPFGNIFGVITNPHFREG